MCNNSNVCLAVKKELSHAELSWVERELCKLYDPFSIIDSAHVLMSECHFASFDTFCGLQKIPQKKKKINIYAEQKRNALHKHDRNQRQLVNWKVLCNYKTFFIIPWCFFRVSCWYFVATKAYNSVQPANGSRSTETKPKVAKTIR